MVEQTFHKRWVAGPIPAVGTNIVFEKIPVVPSAFIYFYQLFSYEFMDENDVIVDLYYSSPSKIKCRC